MRHFANNKKQRGQGLWEALVAGLGLFSLIQGLIFLVLFVWSKIWLNHHLYENLICLNTMGENRLSCQRQFLSKAKPGLLLFQIKEFQCTSNKSSVKLKSFLGTEHHFKKELRKEALP